MIYSISRLLSTVLLLHAVGWPVCTCVTFAGTMATPCRPVIDEKGWWQIAGNPDLGQLNSDKQEPVDFAIWQAADGTWQLWSCIRNTKEAGVTRLFHGWEGAKLTDANWKPRGIAMRGNPKYGESRGGLQAPFVVRQGDEYLMFYGDWMSICLATSQDGKQFTRAALADGKPQLFSDGQGNNTRDAMLLNVDGVWHCYYSAMPEDRGAIFVRKSMDLRDWSKSEAIKVVSGGSPGKFWYQAECPHVVYHKGYFYLFRTSNYRGQPLTTVYRSLDPTSFGIDDDAKIVTTLPIAAPEIFIQDGDYFVAALNPNLDGVRITSLKFIAE